MDLVSVMRLPQRFLQRVGLSDPTAYRDRGYQRLWGNGVEIGALHQPAKLPPSTSVIYCDCVGEKDAAQMFGELDPTSLVSVDLLCNLDKGELAQKLPKESQDFVVVNHVIEHVANPLRLLEQLFFVLKKDGLAVISAPDKQHTFDKKRGLTPFQHLWEEYQQGVEEVTDEHYLDFLRGVHPEVFQNGQEEVSKALESVRRRREHAHVWTSESFKEFLVQGLTKLSISATPLYESFGRQNRFEYFSVWKKR